MKEWNLEILDGAEGILSESIVWHPKEEVLYWVDIIGKKLNKYNLTDRENISLDIDSMIGTVVPVDSGGVVYATESGLYFYNLFHTQKIANPPFSELNNMRFNDGKCDSYGRFWIGTMDKDASAKKGNLYVFNNNKWVKKIVNTTISNGITWYKNKFMYYIDSFEKQIVRYDFDHKKGEIKNQKVIINFPNSMGLPDGMTIDSNGNIWVAMWGGFAVLCINPNDGKIVDKIVLPVPNVSSCSFGGSDLKTLIITTAKQGLSKNELLKYPLSGKIFFVKLSIPGLNPHYFKESQINQTKEKY